MEWSGRAPAPPGTNLARGSKDKEHAMSQNINGAVAVIGIDIGKNSFHVVGLDDRGAIVLRQKWSRGQIEARVGQYAAVPGRHGSLRRCASPQSEAAGIGPRRPIDAGEVCAPILEGTEERLPRCGGDRRSGATSDDEVCGNEDCRTARPAGPASRSRAIGPAAHWHHQSNPRLPVRAGRGSSAGVTVLAR